MSLLRMNVGMGMTMARTMGSRTSFEIRSGVSTKPETNKKAKCVGLSNKLDSELGWRKPA